MDNDFEPKSGIAWGTPETAGLSQRMAYRLAYFMEHNKNPRLKAKDRIPLMAVIHVGLGEKTNKCPGWLPEDLTGYDDEWDDWTRDELNTLQSRLRIDLPRDVLYKVFSVAAYVGEGIEEREFGKSKPRIDVDAPIEEYRLLHTVADTPLLESEEFNEGVFSILDIVDTDNRRFANRRYLEYSENIDCTKPANQTLIKVLVIHEVEIQKATRELSSLDDKVRKAAQSALTKLHTDFSRAAESLALLEKQFKTEPEQENLDEIIQRTHDIRPGWWDTTLEREMALHNLFDLAERMHKTNVGDDDETEPTEIPQPVPQRMGKDVSASVAMSRLKASEHGNVGFAVESTESE